MSNVLNMLNVRPLQIITEDFSKDDIKDMNNVDLLKELTRCCESIDNLKKEITDKAPSFVVKKDIEDLENYKEKVLKELRSRDEIDEAAIKSAEKYDKDKKDDDKDDEDDEDEIEESAVFETETSSISSSTVTSVVSDGKNISYAKKSSSSSSGGLNKSKEIESTIPYFKKLYDSIKDLEITGGPDKAGNGYKIDDYCSLTKRIVQNSNTYISKDNRYEKNIKSSSISYTLLVFDDLNDLDEGQTKFVKSKLRWLVRKYKEYIEKEKLKINVSMLVDEKDMHNIRIIASAIDSHTVQEAVEYNYFNII